MACFNRSWDDDIDNDIALFFKMSTCTCRGTNNNSLILTYFNKDVGKIIIQKVPGCVVLKGYFG